MLVTSKFWISIVFSFSWGHFNSQEKLKTMLMQIFGVTNKEHYGMLRYFGSGKFLLATFFFHSFFFVLFCFFGNLFRLCSLSLSSFSLCFSFYKLLYYIDTNEIPAFFLLLKKSYLHRTQWRYYFDLSHARILCRNIFVTGILR